MPTFVASNYFWSIVRHRTFDSPSVRDKQRFVDLWPDIVSKYPIQEY